VDRRHLVKVRQNSRIISVAVVVAVRMNSDGGREVLGMDIGRPRPRHSGRRSYANSPAAACAASSRSCPTPTRSSRLLSSRCSTPAGSGAASTSRATHWHIPARAHGASSPPSSPPRLARTMPTPREPADQLRPKAAEACRPLRRRGLGRRAGLHDAPAAAPDQAAHHRPAPAPQRQD
jgi:hypothetical protein